MSLNDQLNKKIEQLISEEEMFFTKEYPGSLIMEMVKNNEEDKNFTIPVDCELEFFVQKENKNEPKRPTERKD